ncbi:MAG TPA: S-adenosylmethionine decarboxylase [Patescibacteria group bacterium]|nr:S-adenosylmethionine decarboxylase [Patescibacteria group bacterium]
MHSDSSITAKYEKENPWGMSTAIDLYDCDPDFIRDAEKIKQFVLDLCALIEMKRFGETVVVNFGDNPRVSGFSMTQLIETSLISGHFANESNAAYIDVFSCKKYPPKKTAEFCKNYFKAKKMNFSITFRY